MKIRIPWWTTSFSFYCFGTYYLNINNVKKKDIKHLTFELLDELETVDCDRFDASHYTSLNSLFRGCTKLANADFSKWDTSNVEDFFWCFEGCENLPSVNKDGIPQFRNWKSTGINCNYGGMFRECKSFIDLDLENLNDGAYFEDMFEKCENLKYLNIPNLTFKYEKFTEMPSSTIHNAFYLADALQKIRCKAEAKQIICDYNILYHTFLSPSMRDNGTWELVD